jgi:hypothetical protein
MCAAVAFVGCGSDTEESAADAGASGGSASGGSASGGSASGGSASGGSASGGSASGGSVGGDTGGSTGGAAMGGSAGGATGGAAMGGSTGGEAAGGHSGGAGGEPVPVGEVCDRQACGACFESGNCHIVDNPCNDDPACEPRQREWFACVCLANGDAARAAACDETFAAAQPQHAPPLIECVRNDCERCYAAGTGEPGPAACPAAQNRCSVCVAYHCADQTEACEDDAACSGPLDTLGPCACQAQLSGGDAPACVAEFGRRGGVAAELAACIDANCRATCEF